MQTFGLICIIVGAIAFGIAYCVQLMDTFKKR